MTVRLDTLRNQLFATRSFLETVGLELDDLHHLAYERHTAPAEAKVAGGTRDYALDTHGDPKARIAYRALGEGVSRCCTDLAIELHAAVKVLRAGGEKGRTRARSITVAEHAEALAHQAHRITQGGETVRSMPQPAADQTLALMEARAKKAEKQADRLQRKVDRLESKPKDAQPPGWFRRLRGEEPSLTSRGSVPRVDP